MLNTRLPLLLTIFILLMAACAPLVTPPATPTPVVTEEIPVTGSVAVVQSVEVEILETQPLQVNVTVRGQLPDAGCTTIKSVEQVRDGNTIQLTLVTTTDPLALCAPALTPFEQVVSLDVTGLPPAKYTVEVNGIEQEFELLTRDTSKFKQALVEALNARDFELLRTLMDENFMIGYWQSEGTSNTPEEAIELLKANLLSESSTITADPNKDLVGLLGIDPVTIMGPDAVEASPLFVSGLGPEGKDEAILFIAKATDGSLYWYGMLFAKDGFGKSGTLIIEPVDADVFPTNIRYVMAQQDVQVFNGPGSSFTVIGQVFSGQIAQVTGTSLYGDWWRVDCPSNTAGNCWISADRNLAQPTTLPHSNQPAPDTEAIPTISIVEVVEDETVTIKTRDFPANTKFFVRMGMIGTKGVDGILVDTINSRRGGTFTITFDIPRKLYGEKQIAIRLESNNGYYSYNWFDNTDLAASIDYQPTSAKYVTALDIIVIREGPGSQYESIGSLDEGQKVKVIGLSLDENWWRIRCPDDAFSSCWVSAKPANTEVTQSPK